MVDSVKNNNLQILKVLLRVPQSLRKGDLDLGLLQAAKLGRTECVSHILSTNSVCLDISDSSGNTPLLLAVHANKPDVVRLLANDKELINRHGVGQCSPLHVAAKLGLDDCLDILIYSGAYLDSRDSAGNTPLILAAKNSQLLSMENLVKAGCNVNIQNSEGCAALHYCSHKAMGVNILLAAGADVNVTDSDNITPLLMAATEGFDHVVKTLIQANCKVNIANKLSNKTALHILTYKGHTECVGDLIEAGADVNIYDHSHHTPLWYAIKNKKYDIARFLLRANCMVDTFQCAGHTPIEECPTTLALSLNAIDIIKLFIITGYDKAHMKAALTNKDVIESMKKFDIDHWFQHANDIRSLKQTCRMWIRHHLGNSFYHNVMQLPIPQVMRDFIFMKEIDEEL